MTPPTEHYQPHFLRQAAALECLPHNRIIDISKVFDGNHLTIAEHFADDGIRYLRGQDLSDFFISDADPLYIPEENYDALARSHMFQGDVLVSVVGTIGSIGLVTARHGKLTGILAEAAAAQSSGIQGLQHGSGWPN